MSARILVVDDSASMRQMVSFALTSAGFAVEEAETAPWRWAARRASASMRW